MSAWYSGLPALMALLAILPSTVLSAPLAEQSTEMESYYPVADSTGCYYNFQHYDEGDRILTNEPCLNCTCHNRLLMCYLRVCPFIKAIGENCKVEKRPDQCCPVITCPEVPVQLLTATTQSSASSEVGHLDTYGCSIDRLFYSDGARVPSNPSKPCELCYCIRNKTACVMQECTLNIEGCTPVYQDGVCCPVRYDCEHPEESLETTLSPFSTPTTTTSLIFTTIAPGMPTDCTYNGEVYNHGDPVEKDTCEHCYCMKGNIICAVPECGPTPLDKVNCTALPPKEGKCCTDNYDCDHMSEEELTTTYYELTTQQDVLSYTTPQYEPVTRGPEFIRGEMAGEQTEYEQHKPTDVPDHTKETVKEVTSPKQHEEPIETTEKERLETTITPEVVTKEGKPDEQEETSEETTKEQPYEEPLEQQTIIPPTKEEPPITTDEQPFKESPETATGVTPIEQTGATEAPKFEEPGKEESESTERDQEKHIGQVTPIEHETTKITKEEDVTTPYVAQTETPIKESPESETAKPLVEDVETHTEYEPKGTEVPKESDVEHPIDETSEAVKISTPTKEIETGTTKSVPELETQTSGAVEDESTAAEIVPESSPSSEIVTDAAEKEATEVTPSAVETTGSHVVTPVEEETISPVDHKPEGVQGSEDATEQLSTETEKLPIAETHPTTERLPHEVTDVPISATELTETEKSIPKDLVTEHIPSKSTELPKLSTVASEQQTVEIPTDETPYQAVTSHVISEPVTTLYAETTQYATEKTEHVQPVDEEQTSHATETEHLPTEAEHLPTETEHLPTETPTESVTDEKYPEQPEIKDHELPEKTTESSVPTEPSKPSEISTQGPEDIATVEPVQPVELIVPEKVTESSEPIDEITTKVDVSETKPEEPIEEATKKSILETITENILSTLRNVIGAETVTESAIPTQESQEHEGEPATPEAMTEIIPIKPQETPESQVKEHTTGHDVETVTDAISKTTQPKVEDLTVGPGEDVTEAVKLEESSKPDITAEEVTETSKVSTEQPVTEGLKPEQETEPSKEYGTSKITETVEIVTEGSLEPGTEPSKLEPSEATKLIPEEPVTELQPVTAGTKSEDVAVPELEIATSSVAPEEEAHTVPTKLELETSSASEEVYTKPEIEKEHVDVQPTTSPEIETTRPDEDLKPEPVEPEIDVTAKVPIDVETKGTEQPQEIERETVGVSEIQPTTSHPIYAIKTDEPIGVTSEESAPTKTPEAITGHPEITSDETPKIPEKIEPTEVKPTEIPEEVHTDKSTEHIEYVTDVPQPTSKPMVSFDHVTESEARVPPKMPEMDEASQLCGNDSDCITGLPEQVTETGEGLHEIDADSCGGGECKPVHEVQENVETPVIPEHSLCLGDSCVEIPVQPDVQQCIEGLDCKSPQENEIPTNGHDTPACDTETGCVPIHEPHENEIVVPEIPIVSEHCVDGEPCGVPQEIPVQHCGEGIDCGLPQENEIPVDSVPVITGPESCQDGTDCNVPEQQQHLEPSQQEPGKIAADCNEGSDCAPVQLPEFVQPVDEVKASTEEVPSEPFTSKPYPEETLTEKIAITEATVDGETQTPVQEVKLPEIGKSTESPETVTGHVPETETKISEIEEPLTESSVGETQAPIHEAEIPEIGKSTESTEAVTSPGQLTETETKVPEIGEQLTESPAGETQSPIHEAEIPEIGKSTESTEAVTSPGQLPETETKVPEISESLTESTVGEPIHEAGEIGKSTESTESVTSPGQLPESETKVPEIGEPLTESPVGETQAPVHEAEIPEIEKSTESIEAVTRTGQLPETETKVPEIREPLTESPVGETQTPTHEAEIPEIAKSTESTEAVTSSEQLPETETKVPEVGEPLTETPVGETQAPIHEVEIPEIAKSTESVEAVTSSGQLPETETKVPSIGEQLTESPVGETQAPIHEVEIPDIGKSTESTEAVTSPGQLPETETKVPEAGEPLTESPVSETQAPIHEVEVPEIGKSTESDEAVTIAGQLPETETKVPSIGEPLTESPVGETKTPEHETEILEIAKSTESPQSVTSPEHLPETEIGDHSTETAVHETGIPEIGKSTESPKTVSPHVPETETIPEIGEPLTEGPETATAAAHLPETETIVPEKPTTERQETTNVPTVQPEEYETKIPDDGILKTPTAEHDQGTSPPPLEQPKPTPLLETGVTETQTLKSTEEETTPSEETRETEIVPEPIETEDVSKPTEGITNTGATLPEEVVTESGIPIVPAHKDGEISSETTTSSVEHVTYVQEAVTEVAASIKPAESTETGKTEITATTQGEALAPTESSEHVSEHQEIVTERLPEVGTETEKPFTKLLPGHELEVVFETSTGHVEEEPATSVSKLEDVEVTHAVSEDITESTKLAEEEITKASTEQHIVDEATKPTDVIKSITTAPTDLPLQVTEGAPTEHPEIIKPVSEQIEEAGTIDLDEKPVKEDEHKETPTGKLPTEEEKLTCKEDGCVLTSSVSPQEETATKEYEYPGKPACTGDDCITAETETEPQTSHDHEPIEESDLGLDEENLNENVIPGEGNCLVDGQSYANNSSVPSINRCQLSCKCVSSILQCESVACSPAPSNLENCMPIYHSPESCCPTYSCTMPGSSTIESDSHKMDVTTKTSEQTDEQTVVPEIVIPVEGVTKATQEQQPITEQPEHVPVAASQTESSPTTTERSIVEPEQELGSGMGAEEIPQHETGVPEEIGVTEGAPSQTIKSIIEEELTQKPFEDELPGTHEEPSEKPLYGEEPTEKPVHEIPESETPKLTEAPIGHETPETSKPTVQEQPEKPFDHELFETEKPTIEEQLTEKPFGYETPESEEPKIEEQITDQTPESETPTYGEHLTQKPFIHEITETEKPVGEQITEKPFDHEAPESATIKADEQVTEKHVDHEITESQTHKVEDDLTVKPFDHELPESQTTKVELPESETPKIEDYVTGTPIDHETPESETHKVDEQLTEKPFDHELPVSETPKIEEHLTGKPYYHETPESETPKFEDQLTEKPVDHELPESETPKMEEHITGKPVDHELPESATPKVETHVTDEPESETTEVEEKLTEKPESETHKFEEHLTIKPFDLVIPETETTKLEEQFTEKPFDHKVPESEAPKIEEEITEKPDHEIPESETAKVDEHVTGKPYDHEIPESQTPTYEDHLTGKPLEHELPESQATKLAEQLTEKPFEHEVHESEKPIEEQLTEKPFEHELPGSEKPKDEELTEMPELETPIEHLTGKPFDHEITKEEETLTGKPIEHETLEPEHLTEKPFDQETPESEKPKVEDQVTEKPIELEIPLTHEVPESETPLPTEHIRERPFDHEIPESEKPKPEDQLTEMPLHHEISESEKPKLGEQPTEQPIGTEIPATPSDELAQPLDHKIPESEGPKVEELTEKPYEHETPETEKTKEEELTERPIEHEVPATHEVPEKPVVEVTLQPEDITTAVPEKVEVTPISSTDIPEVETASKHTDLTNELIPEVQTERETVSPSLEETTGGIRSSFNETQGEPTELPQIVPEITDSVEHATVPGEHITEESGPIKPTQVPIVEEPIQTAKPVQGCTEGVECALPPTEVETVAPVKPEELSTSPPKEYEVETDKPEKATTVPDKEYLQTVKPTETSVIQEQEEFIEKEPHEGTLQTTLQPEKEYVEEVTQHVDIDGEKQPSGEIGTTTAPKEPIETTEVEKEISTEPHEHVTEEIVPDEIKPVKETIETESPITGTVPVKEPITPETSTEVHAHVTEEVPVEITKHEETPEVVTEGIQQLPKETLTTAEALVTETPALPTVTIVDEVPQVLKLAPTEAPIISETSETSKPQEEPVTGGEPEDASKYEDVVVTEEHVRVTTKPDELKVPTTEHPTPVIEEVTQKDRFQPEDFLLTHKPTEVTQRDRFQPEDFLLTHKPNETDLYTSPPHPYTTTSKPSRIGELSTSAPIVPAELEPILTTFAPDYRVSSTTYAPDHKLTYTTKLPEVHHEDQGPVDDGYDDEETGAFGPGTCRYGGKVYVSAQQIPRDDPCDFCFCFRSDIICLQQSCPPPIPNCHEEPIRGFCCPRYECPVKMATTVNITTTTTTTTTTLPPHFLAHAYKGRASKTGCQIQGHAYNVGEVIKSASGPCLHCVCGGDGQMECDPKVCSPEPMLRQMIAATVTRR